MSEPATVPGVRAPQVTAMAGLPDRVEVYEVGPRDGLQNEPTMLPVSLKAELVRRLVAAGMRSVELTSLVHPRWVPQLADAQELLAELGGLDGAVLRGLRAPVLVPNDRGLDRALALGVREVAVFVSATEAFAQRNLNTSREQALRTSSAVAARARTAGLAVRGYVSMCFGDPWEGEVDAAAAGAAAAALHQAGCEEISLGDTIGVATPGQVVGLLHAVVASGVPLDALAVHFHDTYGQALANTMIALQHGIVTVDSSAGGLGGCPFAGSATGNLATEDLLWHLHGMGIETGIDLPAVVSTSRWLADVLQRPSSSRAVQALTSPS
ncbi:MAG: hydroxymethylglutaryl-CoA lyase [Angustibacter sp.]